jgi:hypothetical protein
MTAAVAALLLCAVAGSLRGAEPIRFSREILPLLSDNCFGCHGPDEQGRKGGLRLDTHDGALGQGKSGAPAIVPKDSARSEVIRRLLTADADDVMPPPKSNRKLTPAQVDLLRRWIDHFDFAHQRVPRGVFALTVHPQTIGRAHAFLMFERFLDHVLAHDDIWVTTMSDIAACWRDD